MIRTGLAALSLPLLVSGSGCNDHNAPPPSPPASAGPASAPETGPAPSTPLLVHVEDDGKTFDVASGSRITFKLATNAGTGYVWMPTGVDPNVLAQEGERGNEASSDVPGAPKMDVYRFTAQRPGRATIEMDLQRPWAKTQPPAKSIHVMISVH
jgi:predicted secreted protein